MPLERPHRACSISLRIEGDTGADLVRELRHTARELDAGRLSNGVSGSPGASASWEVKIGTSPTSEEYHTQLRAYLDQLKDQEAADAAKETAP
jgi:hypothetical protein